MSGSSDGCKSFCLIGLANLPAFDLRADSCKFGNWTGYTIDDPQSAPAGHNFIQIMLWLHVQKPLPTQGWKTTCGTTNIYLLVCACVALVEKRYASFASGNSSGNLPATFRDSKKTMNVLQASGNPSGKLPEPSGTAAKHQNGTQVFRQAFRNPSGSFRNSSQTQSDRFRSLFDTT